jgi:hypothetical protein
MEHVPYATIPTLTKDCPGSPFKERHLFWLSAFPHEDGASQKYSPKYNMPIA